jgi:hypothetical protein
MVRFGYPDQIIGAKLPKTSCWQVLANKMLLSQVAGDTFALYPGVNLRW